MDRQQADSGGVWCGGGEGGWRWAITDARGNRIWREKGMRVRLDGGGGRLVTERVMD